MRVEAYTSSPQRQRTLYRLLALILLIFAIGIALIALGLNRSLIPIFQSVSHPATDAFFRFCSVLGDPFAYILIILVIYWCYDTVFARDVALVLLLSSYCNGMIKNIVRDPRPPQRYWKYHEDSFGFPSGHSQGAASFWGYIGAHLHLGRRRCVPVVTAVIVALVAVSRLYNGVHDVQDVVTGLIVGLTAVAVAIVGRPLLAAWLARRTRRFAITMALAITVPLFMVILAWWFFPAAENDFGMICGGILGVAAGSTLQQRMIGIEAPQTKRAAIVRLVLGMIVLAAAYAPLSLLLPDGIFFDLIRYSLVALTAIVLAPALFAHLDI